MLKTTVLPRVTVSSDEVVHQRTDITLMSYDKNAHQIKIPTDLTEDEINRVLVIFTFPFDEGVIQLNGSWFDGHIQFTLPETLRTQIGDFYIEVNIDLIDSQITFARYQAKVVKSDIDTNTNQVVSVYFELFEEFVNEVADKTQQSKDAIDVQTVGIEGHANASKQTMDSEANSVSDYGVSVKNTIDAKVDSVELAKTDALTAIDSDVASVDTYAIDAKSNVDGLASDATSAIDNKVASVELAKNQALSDIADKQQDVTDASTQFIADLADTQSTIDAQVTQSQDSLQEVSDTLIAVNDKVTNVNDTVESVNDTADAFTADVVTKNTQVDTLVSDFTADVTSRYTAFDTSVSQAEQTIDDTADAFTADVTSKYNAFDANVRQAGKTIDEILALNEMNLYYDSQLGEYINLNWFYLAQKTGKVYTSEFYNYSVTPSSTGVKKDANAGLVAEPSTNEFAGRDDYMDIGLFKPLDVNGYVDENDDYHVTAIKGDGRFRSDGTNGDVWVMNMTGFMKRFETDTTWGYSYSDVQHLGFTVVPGGKKLDGTIRPFILRAKYPAVRNPHDDNKLASISGQNPEYVKMSYKGQITEFQKKGAQYSGKTTHDDFWVKLMLMLKYASINNNTVGKGCTNYQGQYAPAILETGKSRFVVTNSQARNLVVGSRVSIGGLETSPPPFNRSDSRVHNIRNRVMITGIEPLEDGVNSAVYLDTAPFDTISDMRITTMPWASGACDAIKGVDGSPINGQSMKEPLLINGIEMLHGGYEILNNAILYNDNTNPDNYEVKAFICYDCTKYATTATENYKLLSKRIAYTNNKWAYITTCEVDPQHQSLMVPTVARASSTTGFGDTAYTYDFGRADYSALFTLGDMSSWEAGGLWMLNGSYPFNTLDSATFFGRLSATGRSMGEEV